MLSDAAVSSLASGKPDGVSSRQLSKISSADVAPNTNQSNQEACRHTRQADKNGLLDAILTDNTTESESENSDCEAMDSLSITKSSQADCNVIVNSPMVTGKSDENQCTAIKDGMLNSSEKSMLADDFSIATSNLTPPYKPYCFRSKHRLILNSSEKSMLADDFSIATTPPHKPYCFRSKHRLTADKSHG